MNASVRRAELLLATGGDPHRELDLYGRAVTAVARDLDSAPARARLRDGLESLQSEAEGLRGIGEALRVLLADEDLAWQCYAMSLLAEELADDSDARWTHGPAAAKRTPSGVLASRIRVSESETAGKFGPRERIRSRARG